jgi:hypothetical protein
MTPVEKTKQSLERFRKTPALLMGEREYAACIYYLDHGDLSRLELIGGEYRISTMRVIVAGRWDFLKAYTS